MAIVGIISNVSVSSLYVQQTELIPVYTTAEEEAVPSVQRHFIMEQM